LFWEGESDNCNEIILAYQHDNSNGMETSMLGWGTFPNVGWGGVNPTQSLVDAFEDSEGALLKDSKIYDPKQPWKNRDPRFEVDILYHGSMLKKWGGPFQTIPGSKTKLVDDIERPTGIGACGDATATGYNQKKWVDQTIAIDYANGWQGSKDHPIWRFAEVLLWFAEADNEVNGPTEAGLEAINRVRSRVGQPVLQKTNGALPTYVATKEAFRARIRNEYRVEMALEGKRYYAIRRWRDEKGDPIALKVMNEPILGMPYDEKTKTPFVGPNVIIPGRPEMVRFRAHNIFDPIPQKEIDLNKDLKQNPGYE
ncbi:MAG: RagB/SusD family nutrient uptake outer membrane protein, partial [Rikenellaceae bacterium]